MEMPRVLVALPHEQTFARALLTGIGRYVNAYGGWEFVVPGLRGWGKEYVKGEAWEGDGMMVQVVSEGQMEFFKKRGVPFVNLTARVGCPTVANDNRAMGVLAAEHFEERGFRRWGFFDVDGTIYAQQRMEAFVGKVREWGMECNVYQSGRKPSEDHEELVRHGRAFLECLRFPVAVFAANDVRARALLDAAAGMGIKVPNQLAILGVDNEVFCEFTTPTMSTILPDGERIGYEAAVMLGRLMGGEKLEQETVLVPPLGVKVRGTTNTLAVEDELVAEALRVIRENGHRAMDVVELLGVVPASRRTLERRFVAVMGHGPGVEIRKAQMEHVKRLLVETDWLIERVARASAFGTPANLGRVFREELGESPGAYRGRFRTG